MDRIARRPATDALPGELEKDPEAGVQTMMAVMQQIADSMTGNLPGPSALEMSPWGAGPHPMDGCLFGLLVQGASAEDLQTDLSHPGAEPDCLLVMQAERMSYTGIGAHVINIS